MRYRKELITTIGTIGCAVGIGFVMQQSQAAEARYTKTGPGGAVLANAGDTILDVEEITLTSGDLATGIQPPAREAEVTFAAAPAPPLPDATAQEATTVDTADTGCEITATARPVAAAMVNLTLDASCMPNERVTVLHSGLLFNEMTDDGGQIDITLPAFAEDAMFVVAFSNGEGAVAQAKVEEFGSYDRIAVQWKGDTGFELHARENGADYGEAGHVWSGETRDMSFGVTGDGGYITVLGNPDVADGLVAEVYTYPVDSAEVDLSVEALVAENNCGSEIEAETLQTNRGAEITSRNVTLSVPECDAAGNFLVLNNLFEDLKVASN